MSHSVHQDQAASLRRILRPAALRVLPVAGADAVLRATVVLNLATAAAQAGHQVVVLDQSHGDVAAALGLTVRHELLDLIEGRRRFAETALAAPEGVRVLPGARGMAALAAEGARPEALFGAFLRIDQPADLVLVNVADPATAGALMPGGAGEVLLAAATDVEALTGAYAVIKQLALANGLKSYRLVLSGGAPSGTAATATVAANLAWTARRFVGARVLHASTIPDDAQLARAAAAREAVVRVAPRTPAAVAFTALAGALADWDAFELDAASGAGAAAAALAQ